MTSDTMVLVGIGCAALLAIWLVYSLIKKAVGLVLLAAVVVAGFMLWSNPDMQRSVIQWVSGIVSGR